MGKNTSIYSKRRKRQETRLWAIERRIGELDKTPSLEAKKQRDLLHLERKGLLKNLGLPANTPLRTRSGLSE